MNIPEIFEQIASKLKDAGDIYDADAEGLLEDTITLLEDMASDEVFSVEGTEIALGNLELLSEDLNDDICSQEMLDAVEEGAFELKQILSDMGIDEETFGEELDGFHDLEDDDEVQ